MLLIAHYTLVSLLVALALRSFITAYNYPNSSQLASNLG